jgi:N-acetylglucosaminyldiphosphoundecaprenol N-acetyl-beta-D-mannosaminyltransferase
MQQVEILGFRVCDESVPAVAGWACDGIIRGQRRSIAFLNPHSVVVAARDESFRRALDETTLLLCDGAGLALASVVLNSHRLHRVYGFQFFVALSEELSRRRRGRVFFLGGSEDLLVQLCDRYRRDFPGVVAVAGYSPPFRHEFTQLELDDMAQRVRKFGADVLWVGLGSPKQEKVLASLLAASGAKCGAAVGAVFDFYSDTVPHAPEFMRRIGLQWLHRLVLEPRRLWRRTFVSAPLFVWRVLRTKLGSLRAGG